MRNICLRRIAFSDFAYINRPGEPIYIVSPWSRRGWINSQVFDHTSVLRFLEARFGIRETNINPFPRAVRGDLISAFNFKTPNAEILPALAGRRSKEEADAHRAAQEAPGGTHDRATCRRHACAPGYRRASIAVTCDTDASFYRRFSGRVENGRDSVSDPAMGMADL